MLDWFLNVGHKFAGIVIFVTQLLVHYEDILDRFSSLFGLKKIIERRKGDKHMNILEVPQFIKDAVQLANDLKAAESLLAPQFPQLVADAEKLKTDGESLLGVPPTAPDAPKAA